MDEDEDYEDDYDDEGGPDESGPGVSVKESEMISALHAKNQTMTGICFTLAMRGEDGEVTLHERINQPCYGELRKYKSIHDDATQPEYRPGDLRHPFPSGTPEALAIGLPDWHYGEYDANSGKVIPKNFVSENQKFFDFILSDRSPFVRGFGGEKNIEWSEGQKGFVLLSLDIDPTVLVNLLKFFQSYPKIGEGTTFCTYLDDGLSEIEAFVASYCCNFGVGIYANKKYTIGLAPVNTYVFPQKADLQRILDQNPVDLTGGTLRNRFDYSRKSLHEVFYSKTGVNFFEEISKTTGFVKGYRDSGIEMTKEDFLKYFKIVYDREVQVKERKAA